MARGTASDDEPLIFGGFGQFLEALPQLREGAESAG